MEDSEYLRTNEDMEEPEPYPGDRRVFIRTSHTTNPLTCRTPRTCPASTQHPHPASRHAATSQPAVHENQPYDESVDVQDAEEVASLYTPSPGTQKDRGADLGMSRGNTPPDSRIYDNNFDEEFEQPPPQAMQPQSLPPQQQQPQQPAPLQGGQQQKGYDDEDDDDDEEEDGSSDDEEDDDEGSGGAVEGAYDPADYEHLPVTPEIKELFQYITRYTPQTIELDHKIKPFIPDFIPAVGDIDAFIKVSRPDSKPDSLGLVMLDEPCAKQSDPTVLDLTLRSMSKQANLKGIVVKSIEDAEKHPKAIDNWIQSISDLHRSKPPPNVHYTKNMPDIDTLMQEWPAEFEELLKEVSLPTADLECDLNQYVDMICAILDIPIYKSKIQSLHVLFTLYSEFKNSQHFRSLAADNKLDNALKRGSESGIFGGEEDRLVL